MNTLITKHLVLEALRTEPVFFSGNWARYDGGETEACEVCAVGAVLKSVLRREAWKVVPSTIDTASQVSASEGNSDYVGRIADPDVPLLDPTRDAFWRAQVEHNPLAALSRFFELLAAPLTQGSGGGIVPPAKTGEVRKACIQFVHKFFPAKFELPAADRVEKYARPAAESEAP
jgi:hypothetical protein